ncbi:glycerol uptake operon antiterminator [Scopulibacillus darangshiensis]|uniref:Glycerol uptake operon antiterminator regulatory protein n=1 Tax=Scopulibacillus darangshiensis TaxID=442528 RepID=A0A4R2NRH1_9BACL|nr:glycerol-3-phosphate responsive antiterminator [Scopulibacillus darangshiensis]TCP24081.1 glycerol uptake operon antiterminator [Scopulibacillus darangshiensis]
MDTLEYALSRHPIIVSLTDQDDLEKALVAESSIIILIHADICTLNQIVKRIKETDKLIFVHIDLMKGLKKDASSIRYLAEHVGIDGIVTTHMNLIPAAKRYRLLTIQRVFILDSASIEQGFKSVRESNPDAVEILPGIAVPHIRGQLKNNIKQIVIAGGLINTEDESLYILKNGAKGVSGSSTELWHLSSKIKQKLKNAETQEAFNT